MKKQQRRPADLFESHAFEERIRAFAESVARRHRGRPAAAGDMLGALRAYHRTWSLFAAIPPLDEHAIRLAVATYGAARAGRRRTAA
jgi:hypothetical protein